MRLLGEEQEFRCKDALEKLLGAMPIKDPISHFACQRSVTGFPIQQCKLHTSGRNPCSRIVSLVACTDLVLLKE